MDRGFSIKFHEIRSFYETSFSRITGNFVPRFPSVHVDKHWELQSVANRNSVIHNVLSHKRELERATRLWTEQSRDHGLILHRNERCFSFPQDPDKLWVPSSSCSASIRAFFNKWSRRIINYYVLPEPSELTGLRSCFNPHTYPELLG